MAKYSGTTVLISGITQANNGDFPLVDASAVQVNDNGKRLNTILNEINDRFDNINSSAVDISEEELNAMLAEILI